MASWGKSTGRNGKVPKKSAVVRRPRTAPAKKRVSAKDTMSAGKDTPFVNFIDKGHLEELTAPVCTVDEGPTLSPAYTPSAVGILENVASPVPTEEATMVASMARTTLLTAPLSPPASPSLMDGIKEQIAMKKVQREKARLAEQAWEKKIEQEAEQRGSPWGRPGSGAPVRDADGQPVANLRHVGRNLVTVRAPKRTGTSQPIATTPKKVSERTDAPTPGTHKQTPNKEEITPSPVETVPVAAPASPPTAPPPAPAESPTTYGDIIKQQIAMKKAQREKARLEHLAWEKKIEREAEERGSPWGRPGSGAPVRNADGQPVANLRHVGRSLVTVRAPKKAVD